MAEVKMDVFYPYSIEKVWNALVEPEALAQWNEAFAHFRPVEGHKFTFQSKPTMGWKGISYFEVLKVEQPHTLSWSTRAEEDSKEILVGTLSLKAEGEGTRLNLLVDGMTGMKGLFIKGFVVSAWKKNFAAIEKILNKGGKS